MALIARAFWTVAPGRGEVRAEPLAEPGPEEVVVRTLASGVSRGTEALVFSGRVPESERQRMRAPFQAGDFPFPVKYGYAAVGVVEAGPDALVGRRVFVLHPHQDRFVVPAAAVIPVPDAVPTPRAVLAANMETALNVVWDAEPVPGERAVVVGAGVVGLLVAFLLSRFPALAVTVVDRDAAKEGPCRALGLSFAQAEDAPRDADLVVHASGSPDAVAQALALLAFEGRLIEASWFGDRPVALPLGGAFHSRRLRLISSQVGAVAPRMRGRRSHAERLALALSLLDDARLDALLDGPSRFEDLPRTMAQLAASPGALCHVVRYDPGP
ncbi:MAG: zinc-binding alcohol dehydrogenase [Elioraea sp.]|nr:zinc-binding alcohol dehydrogenase [Elioraea sp.]MDW8443910.1 zinc-binding alcohol dehydrogenase [Acetobacteraceae bacterium]